MHSTPRRKRQREHASIAPAGWPTHSQMGNQLTCPEGICRRKGICFGMRDEERYSLAFLVFPPCVPLDLEIIETCRQEISTELKRVAAGEMRAAAGNCRRRGP